MKNGVHIRKGKQSLEELSTAVHLLADVEVLVGFPEETTERPEEMVTNAALGYIHDNGAPEVNIPARPFMLPGMEACMPQVTAKMAQITNGVIRRDEGAALVEAGMHQVGMIVQLSIQNAITEGPPPPLADSTLRARARKRPGRIGPGIELLSRSKGNAPSTDFVKPLTDTGEMKKSVKYVIRSRKKRKK